MDGAQGCTAAAAAPSAARALRARLGNLDERGARHHAVPQHLRRQRDNLLLRHSARGCVGTRANELGRCARSCGPGLSAGAVWVPAPRRVFQRAGAASVGTRLRACRAGRPQGSRGASASARWRQRIARRRPAGRAEREDAGRHLLACVRRGAAAAARKRSPRRENDRYDAGGRAEPARGSRGCTRGDSRVRVRKARRQPTSCSRARRPMAATRARRRAAAACFNSQGRSACAQPASNP